MRSCGRQRPCQGSSAPPLTREPVFHRLYLANVGGSRDVSRMSGVKGFLSQRLEKLRFSIFIAPDTTRFTLDILDIGGLPLENVWLSGATRRIACQGYRNRSLTNLDIGGRER